MMDNNFDASLAVYGHHLDAAGLSGRGADSSAAVRRAVGRPSGAGPTVMRIRTGFAQAADGSIQSRP